MQPAKVATPATAETGFEVHESTAPDVPVPATMLNVTAAVLVVTALPNASLTATTGCVGNAVAMIPAAGSCTTLS